VKSIAERCLKAVFTGGWLVAKTAFNRYNIKTFKGNNIPKNNYAARLLPFSFWAS
jgi:hypothetical protein